MVLVSSRRVRSGLFLCNHRERSSKVWWRRRGPACSNRSAYPRQNPKEGPKKPDIFHGRACSGVRFIAHAFRRRTDSSRLLSKRPVAIQFDSCTIGRSVTGQLERRDPGDRDKHHGFASRLGKRALSVVFVRYRATAKKSWGRWFSVCPKFGAWRKGMLRHTNTFAGAAYVPRQPPKECVRADGCVPA